MIEEALQVAVNQRSDSPRIPNYNQLLESLIGNQNKFDLAIKDCVQEDIAKIIDYNTDTKFARKTKMSGHMSNTLQAELAM